jgi:tellurite resistance protein TerA
VPQALTQGGNCPVEVAVIDVVVRAGAPVDVAALLLGADGKVRSDADFVFYNQPGSAGVEFLGAQDGRSGGVRCNLATVPGPIERIAVVASVDGSGPANFGALGPFRVDVLDLAGPLLVTYAPSGLGEERAVVLMDVYRRGGKWKVRAVGQGWASGLAGIATSFGVNVAEPSGPGTAGPASPVGPVPVPTVPAAAIVPVTPTATPTVPATPKVQLGKVTLEKRGSARRVDLLEQGGRQVLHFNLNWGRQAPKRSLVGSRRSSVPPADLDLGCMYEMADGRKGVIQPLGGSFGDRNGPPFIYLDKDDRSGAAADGENLYVCRPDLIRRVLVFALIYEGAEDFVSVGGVLTIRDQEGNETVVPLNSPDPGLRLCVIAVATNDGETINISKEERYFKGHRLADEAYGFGFSWRAGRK